MKPSNLDVIELSECYSECIGLEIYYNEEINHILLWKKIYNKNGGMHINGKSAGILYSEIPPSEFGYKKWGKL